MSTPQNVPGARPELNRITKPTATVVSEELRERGALGRELIETEEAIRAVEQAEGRRVLPVLRQTMLRYDVFVSPPVAEDSLAPTWPGREPARVQTQLNEYLKSVGPHTAANSSSGSVASLPSGAHRRVAGSAGIESNAE